MFVRAYLRASTDDQDANRACDQLRAFAEERGLLVAAYYVENERGAKLARPELFRLLADSHPSDVLLIEQVDRLCRLTSADWELLGAELALCQVRVVTLDLPTSWMLATPADEFTGRMFAAVNGIRSTFSQQPPARTTRIAAAAKLTARGGPRLPGSATSAPRTSGATPASPPCSSASHHGPRSGRPSSAHERRSR